VRYRFPPVLAACLIGFAASGCERPDASPELHRTTSDERSTESVSEPRVTIGESFGEGHTLHRVFGGMLLQDGRIAVGDGSAGEIRIFEPDGRHAYSTGGLGSGPGEFRSINWIGRMPADSILVWDLRLRRFSVLDPGGAYVRDFRPEVREGQIRPIAVHDDGSIFVAVETGYDPQVQTGRVRDALILLRLSASGEPVGTLGEFAGSDWLLYEHPSSFRAVRLPLGRRGHLAVSADRIFYGSSEAGQVEVFDLTGNRVGSLALPVGRRAISDRELRDFVEEEIPDRAERGIVLRHIAAEALGNAPVLTGMSVDREYNLWVRGFPEPGNGTVEWLIVPVTGGAVRTLRLPVAAVPLDLRDGNLLARESDADGVQRVTVRKVDL
jgi:hypothetical protein